MPLSVLSRAGNITAVPLTPMTGPEVSDAIVNRRRGTGFVISNLNLHGLYLYLRDSAFARFTQEARVTLIDGWPLLVLAWLSGHGRVRRHHRIGSTDWLDDLMNRGRHITITAVGGTATTAVAARASAQRGRPHITWLAFDGFDFAPDPTQPLQDLRDALAASDLVLVGLGMPKQEQWITSHRDELRHAVVANVGGCIDYLGGAQVLAPRWMGRWGMEWLFRLVRSPRRLAFRYLVEPLLLLTIIAAQLAVGAAHVVWSVVLHVLADVTASEVRTSSGHRPVADVRRFAPSGAPLQALVAVGGGQLELDGVRDDLLGRRAS